MPKPVTPSTCQATTSTARNKPTSRFDFDHVAGSLLGGAVGDALGAPVEFMRWREIQKQFGPNGITDPPIVNGVSEITDDTQMTLFTAEGVIRAISREADCRSVIHRAYLRWLHTQGERVRGEHIIDGWLIGCRELHARRAPGNTCLSALASGEMGSIGNPLNDSKGCGGVMRVAPTGLCPSVSDPFMLAAEAAAITHGHPSGYLAAGAFAAMIRFVMEGSELPEAISRASSILKKHKGHEETTEALKRAVTLAGEHKPSAEAVESLGGGWVAEEALAIAIYCALVYPNDFPAALRLAANHSGDSDSTAAITGNLLGASLGRSAIPPSWLAHLELRSEIETLSRDLLLLENSPDWSNRYPPH